MQSGAMRTSRCFPRATTASHVSSHEVDGGQRRNPQVGRRQLPTGERVVQAVRRAQDDVSLGHRPPPAQARSRSPRGVGWKPAAASADASGESATGAPSARSTCSRPS